LKFGELVKQSSGKGGKPVVVKITKTVNTYQERNSQVFKNG